MWFGWSSRVLFPERKTDESLSNVSFPSGAGYDFARSVRISSLRAVRLDAELLRREPALRHRHRRGVGTAEEEPLVEDLPHVPHLAEVADDVARPQLLVVRVEGADPGRVLAAAERAPGGLGREPPRLDRVVDALQRRHVDEARALAREQQPRRVEARRQRVVPALGDRLGAPRDALAAVEDLPDELVGLELLQHVVHRELGVAVLEPGDESERDELVPHRVDERAAELAVLGALPERPAHRVDDLAQRLRHPPHLLDAERPDLRVRPRKPEAVDRRTGQVAGCALREHGHARDEVGPRLEVRELLPVPAAALVAGADPADGAVVDEQLLRRGLREEHRPALLRPLGEPAAELGDRDDDVPVVPHRRRRRDPDRRPLRQQVDALAWHLAVRRDRVELRPVAEQRPQRARVDDGSREQVRARALALVDHGHRHLAEPLGRFRVLLHQLPEPDRARETRGPRADDADADLDALVGRVGGHGDRLRRREGRREVGRPDGHERRSRTSSVSLGTIWWTSPTTPRSEYSKIGAFGSLLIATMTCEDCMPTLCWIAPEIPSAT